MPHYDLARISAGLCEVTPAPREIAVVSHIEEKTPFCVPATIGHAINPGLLNSAGSETVIFEITNNDTDAVEVIIGSELAIAGNYQRYGLDPSAVDNPAVEDQFGNNLQKVQGFSALVNNHSVIVGRVEIFDASNSAQLNQRLRRGSIDLDANNCTRSSSINFCPACPFGDADDSRAYDGPFALSDRNYLQYRVLGATAGDPSVPNSVTIQLEIVGKATVENFTNQGTCL